MKKNKAVKIIKKTASCLLSVLSVAVIGSVIITGCRTGKPTVFGYRPMFVCSGSMEPTIKTFSIVVGVPVNADDVQTGDICTYSRGSTMICHRVVDITEEGFIFRGDNNPADDPPVAPELISYRVIWY